MKKHEEVPEDKAYQQCSCCDDWSYDGCNFYGCWVCGKCLDTPNDVPGPVPTLRTKSKVKIEEIGSEL